MNSLFVCVPNDQWLSIPGGNSSDLLQRLNLPADKNIEVGPTIFRVIAGEAFIELELRHRDFDPSPQIVHISGAAEMLKPLSKGIVGEDTK